MLSTRHGLHHLLRHRPPSSSALRRRLLATASTNDDSEAPPRRRLLYEAPLAAPIKSLKRVSVTTAMLSLTIPPAMVFAGSESVPLSGQIAVAATTMIASIGSTAAIHFLFSPYVLRLSQVLEAAEGAAEAEQHREQQPPPLESSSVLEAHTMTLFGGEAASQFRVNQVVPFGTKPPRPFVNFGTTAEASSSSADRYYFVHTSIFEEKKLLRHLLGRPLKDDER